MKRKLIYIGCALLALFAFNACEETDDSVEEYPNWQETNENYFSSLYDQTLQKIAQGDKTWKVFKSWAVPDSIFRTTHEAYSDYIVVHVLNEGTSTSGSPLYSDSASVHYLGRLLPSTTYADGYVFDKSFYGDYNPKTSTPTLLGVNSTVIGFSTALINMKIGDRWMVYIPYQLGYGEIGNGAEIPGYSTLIFDLTLEAFYRLDADKIY